MIKEIVILVIALAAFVESKPQFPSPPMPPGMPSPPGMPGMLTANLLTRLARQAPPPPDALQPSRVVRQAPPPPPSEVPKRVARHAFIESPEIPKKITQESFYSSITTFNREKRGTSKGR